MNILDFQRSIGKQTLTFEDFRWIQGKFKFEQGLNKEKVLSEKQSEEVSLENKFTARVKSKKYQFKIIKKARILFKNFDEYEGMVKNSCLNGLGTYKSAQFT